MSTGRKYPSHLKIISWLLIAAVLTLTIQPMHLHLQHIGDSSSLVHDHVVDLHFVMDNIDPLHHDDAAIFSVTPDGMLKKISDQHLLAVFLFFSILLFGTAFAVKQAPRPCVHRPKPGWFAVRPPLRAPPLQ